MSTTEAVDTADFDGELHLNGHDELALHIYAQFGLVNTFVPQ